MIGTGASASSARADSHHLPARRAAEQEVDDDELGPRVAEVAQREPIRAAEQRDLVARLVLQDRGHELEEVGVVVDDRDARSTLCLPCATKDTDVGAPSGAEGRLWRGSRRNLEPPLAQRASGKLGAARQAEALEQPSQVRLDRLRGDPKPRRDLVVREAVDDCRHDIPFARGEARPGRPWSHAEREPTGSRGADRVEQLRDGCGLQDVAGGAEAQRRVDVLGIVVRGDDHDRRQTHAPLLEGTQPEVGP